MVDVIDKNLSSQLFDGVLEKVKAKLSHHKTVRHNWDSIYRDITRYVNPYRGDFQRAVIRGERRTRDIVDTTAPWAAGEFASALSMFLTDPTELWFAIETFNPRLNDRRRVKIWFHEIRQIMLDLAFNAPVACFQDTYNQGYGDIASYGTTVILADDPVNEPIIYKGFELGTCYIDEDHRGRVSEVYREFQWPFHKVWKKWGPEATRVLTEKYKDKPNHPIDIVHAVEPVDQFSTLQTSGLFGWTSHYLIPNEGLILDEGGYRDFPYIVPRWRKQTHEVYGRSQIMMALPHVKLLNAMMRTIIKAGQKAVEPALQAPDDGMTLPIRTNPNGMNYYRAGTTDRIEPINTGADPGIGVDLLQAQQEQILRIMFIDVLRLRKDKIEMTATEVLRLTDDQLRSIAPLVGRMHSELNTPTVVRTFNVLNRRGMFPPMPPELRGQQFRIKFSSPIVRAQKSAQIDNINRLMNNFAPIIQFRPEVADRIDADAYMEVVHDMSDVPENLLIPREVAEAERETQQQAAVLEQETQRLEAASGIAKNLQSSLEGQGG